MDDYVTCQGENTLSIYIIYLINPLYSKIW